MVETATILQIDGERIVVSCAGERCEGCGSSFCNVTERRFPVRNTENVPVKLGDRVELFVPPSKTVAASFVALILPLILFVVCYALAAALGIAMELFRVLLGVGGLGSGFALNLLYARSARGATLPVVVRVISPSRSGRL